MVFLLLYLVRTSPKCMNFIDTYYSPRISAYESKGKEIWRAFTTEAASMSAIEAY